jgi:hypothetical protein
MTWKRDVPMRIAVENLTFSFTMKGEHCNKCGEAIFEGDQLETKEYLTRFLKGLEPILEYYVRDA